MRGLVVVLAAVFTFAIPVAASASAVTSTFDTTTEGWSVFGDEAGPVTWISSGGSPGGYISVTDSVVGGVMYFLAPGKYLGNQSSAYGSALSFSLIQNFPDAPDQFPDGNGDVVLTSSSMTLAYDLANYPTNGSWTPYSVSLTAGAWHIGSDTGALATDAQIQSVLSNLTGLQIRAEYQTGPDTDGLDSVSFGNAASAVPGPIVGAGLPGLVAAFGGLLAWRRRKTMNQFSVA